MGNTFWKPLDNCVACKSISLFTDISIESFPKLSINRLKLKDNECAEQISSYSLRYTSLSDKCQKEPDCDQNAKYRTIDGSCNNLKYPLWGRYGVETSNNYLNVY